ncbi:MAG: dinitrogenase iron-molybdenum cofactor biosynthesis protein [Gammaproteobacteria bacterium]|nr:dinitrogenase iron-molybdenum cofactor biosynthesis protein [Gammaproteobacteria bacterium]
MNAAELSKEIALRIGLAARALPDTDAARMLTVLADAVGLPPTGQSLSGLTVQSLKKAAEGELSEIDTDSLKKALSCLKGETGISTESLPEIQACENDELADSVRVACASNSGELVDGHFGSCKRFLIYQVSGQELRLIDIREIDESQAPDDKNGYRASLIADCQILFVVSIGGPAAAKVIRAGIHPVKRPQVGPAKEILNELQQVIGDHAPPWLAKIMGQTPEQRIRFEREAGPAEDVRA